MASVEDVRTLVERAQAGDSAAFALLYDRYVEPVYWFVFHRVRQDRELAEDLTAETFVRALRGLRSYRWQGRDLGAWLVTIARNLVVDHLRSAPVRREVPMPMLAGIPLADLDLEQIAEVTDVGPETIALDREQRVLLLAAISRLIPRHREVIILRFYLGLTLAQTAAAMDLAVTVVKSLQYRAVRALAGELPVGVTA